MYQWKNVNLTLNFCCYISLLGYFMTYIPFWNVVEYMCVFNMFSVCVYMYTYVPWYSCGGQNNCRVGHGTDQA